MTRKLYILTFLLLFGISLSADNTPMPINFGMEELEALFHNIDEEILSSKRYTEIDGKFVEIDPNRKEAFFPLPNDPYGFADDLSDVVSTFTSEETTNIDKARLALNAVKEGAKFVQKFDGESLVNLPQGISQTFDDTKVLIAVNAIRIYPTYTALEVFVEIDRPDFLTPLVFYAPDIKFSLKGGLSGPSKVGLLGDMVVPVEEGKSKIKFKRAIYDPAKQEFTGGTFIQFDCDGFQSLGLDAAFILSREWVVPIIPEQNIINANGRVTGDFTTILTDINNMVFELSLRDFVIPQCDRVAWNIENAVLDFSETESLFNFPLPNLPYNPIDDGFLVDQESWKGVKIDEISMTWLDTVASGTQTSFLGLTGQSIVIDHNGFSGIVKVTGLLPMDVGKMDGWDFSVDLLGVKVIQNQVSGFAFEGAVVVPILEKDQESPDTIYSAINYGAHFDFVDRKYGMFAGLESPLSFDMKVFKGVATLEANSRLEIEYREDDGYGIEAVLNGSYSMSEKVIFGKKVSIPTVGFQGLAISSQKRYVREVGTWGISTANGKFMGIRYNVKSMGVDTINGNPLIQIAADINFAQADGVQISAATAFTVEGEIKDEDQSQKYKWSTININLIQIEADLEAVYFYGEIILFKEFPIWGTGFQGKVELYVTGANGKSGGNSGGSDSADLGIGAMALFGTTENENDEEYRYFLIDLMARLGDGIPIPSTGIKLLGAGGGVYYHMNQLSISQNIQDVAYDPGDPNDVDAYTQYIMDRIGVSLSGAQYLPDDSKLFGVNLNVVIGLDGKPDVLNANIGFTIQINSTFGIDFIRLKGIMNVMSDIAWTGPSVNGFSAVSELNLVFSGEDPYLPPGFYGESHLFVRFAGKIQNITIDALVGAHDFADVPPYFQTIFNNAGVDPSQVKYAGSIESQLNQYDWFVNAGTPSNRLALRSDLLILTLELGAYMDVGTNIPTAPPLPPDIADQLNWTPIPEPARATGNGFAFGANFGLTLGGDYTVFTAILDIQAGFDLMLQQYDPVYCDGEPLGVLFFYASGQAYASIHGEVSGFGYVLFDVGAAAAQAFKAPNPTYSKGAVSGYYNVAFGAYQGSCYYPFEIGELCDSDEDLEVQIDLIADLSPAENVSYVSTDMTMTGATYFPLNEVSTLINEDSEEVQYILEVDNFELLKNGVAINGVETENSYSISFVSEELLEEQTDYTVNFKVSLKNITTNEIEYTEEKSHFFTTGNHPEIITPDNVAATWPQNGQFNFYHDLDNTGVVALERGQDYLFQSGDLYYAKITSSYPAAEVARPLTYSPSSRTISFNIPSSLKNAQAYKIQIVRATDNSTNQIGDFIEQVPNFLTYIEGDTLPPLRAHETLLYTYYFRKSTFDHPQEKYETLVSNTMVGSEILIDEIQEPFGVEELIGLHGKEKSFSSLIDLENTPFFKLYENYQTPDGIIKPYENNSGRSDYNIAIKDNLSPLRIAKYGAGLPYKAIDIYQENTNLFTANASNIDEINALNEQEIIYGLDGLNISLIYNLDSVAYGDIKYFIETSFNSSEYNQTIQNIYNLPFGDCQAGSVTACCYSSDNFRNEIKDNIEAFYNNQNDIFKGFYTVENDQNSCGGFPKYSLNDYQSGFLRTDVQNYTLENGMYPIFFRYTNPLTGAEYNSSVIDVSRNSGSE